MKQKFIAYFIILAFVAYIYYLYILYLPSLNAKQETVFINKKTSTIVTAYFQIKSKHPTDDYFRWIKNFLSIQDPMVIITTSSLKDFMLENRPPNLKTKIIIRNMSQFFVRKRYGDDFWKKQHDMDIEKSLHKSEYLYWIWDEKSHWLKEIALLDPFHTKNFIWMDMGSFRNTKYNDKLVVTSDFTEHKLLARRMLFLRVSKAVKWLQSKYMSKSLYRDVIDFNMYIGGTVFGGTRDAILLWHDAFYKEMDAWANASKFIGKDQSIMISCCYNNPELCAYVDPNDQFGDPFFYMQPWFHGETDNKVYIPEFDVNK